MSAPRIDVTVELSLGPADVRALARAHGNGEEHPTREQLEAWMHSLIDNALDDLTASGGDS